MTSCLTGTKLLPEPMMIHQVEPRNKLQGQFNQKYFFLPQNGNENGISRVNLIFTLCHKFTPCDNWGDLNMINYKQSSKMALWLLNGKVVLIFWHWDTTSYRFNTVIKELVLLESQSNSEAKYFNLVQFSRGSDRELIRLNNYSFFRFSLWCWFGKLF